MIFIKELPVQKTVLFVGYKENCRLIERELVGPVEAEFKLLKTTPHYQLEAISGLKADIILFDVIGLYANPGPEIIEKLGKYYGKFWRYVLETGLANQVVILFEFKTDEEKATEKREKKAKIYVYKYRHPCAIVATRERLNPEMPLFLLDKSWFSAPKPENKPHSGDIPDPGSRLPLNDIWDYARYQANASSTGELSLDKLTSSVRDYAMILRQIDPVVEKE